MKKFLGVVLGLLCSGVIGVAAEAKTPDEVIIDATPEEIDFSKSFTEVKTRSGQSTIYIDGEK